MKKHLIKKEVFLQLFYLLVVLYQFPIHLSQQLNQTLL